jgi:ATP/maltotriose-dependent transcriptional regulator MalT
MATPPLRTKLGFPPIQSELASRPHLVKRLNAAPDRKLPLMSASAGFGKTPL